MHDGFVILIAGMGLGFLFQKARLLRYAVQIRALRLTDGTLYKFIFSCSLVAAVGFWGLKDLGEITLPVKMLNGPAQLLGGLLFGCGWGLLGYDPVTQFGALGEGRWDAIWGMLGMAVGAVFFVQIFPILDETLLAWAPGGPVTLPSWLGWNPWQVIISLAVLFMTLFWIAGRRKADKSNA